MTAPHSQYQDHWYTFVVAFFVGMAMLFALFYAFHELAHAIRGIL